MTKHKLLSGGALALLVLSCLAGRPARAAIIEDFDGSGTTAFTLTNSGGSPPAIINGGASGNLVRLANLDGSNNNSIAFDEAPSATGPAPGGIHMAFDFRMTDDAANAAAGGCCGSAADGLGIGLFATAIYGSAGGANPTTMGQGSNIWERPAFNAALTIGLDIFQNIDEINVNWDGAEVANANVQPFLDLNNNKIHRAVLDVKPNGANALADLMVLEDIHGATKSHAIFSDLNIPGLDLANLPGWRLIAGGRTGGAFVAGDLDNIYVEAIPEPSSLTLLALSSLGLLGRRRRR